MPFPFTPRSFWLPKPPARMPALASREQCDVAIIGGGYTGLSAALRLKAKGVDVALVEADFCGAGASSRAAGHITPTVGKDVVSCIRAFGARKGLQLVAYAETAIETFEETIAAHVIACDYVAQGNIIAGVHERQRRALESSAETAARHGLKMTFLDPASMQARGMPGAFKFGVHEGLGGVMDPGKYILGLRRAALDAGVRIFENSRVRRIRSGKRVVISTPDGEISAEKALLAVNAYAPEELGLMRSRILPVRVNLCVTRPLTADERASLGWINGEGVYTAHESLENFRFTADGRVLMGSKFVHYEKGGRLASGYQPEAFEGLSQVLKTRLPTLAGVPIDVFWGGWIAMTLDFLPTWGRIGDRKNIYFFTGCNGHGIPQCTLMGAAMADEMLGAGSPHLDLLKRFEAPLPPEPLCSMVFNAIAQHLEKIDRRVDDDLQRRAAA